MTWEEAVLWLRQRPEQSQLVKDCFFDDPLVSAAERYYQSTEWQAVRRLLTMPPGNALDLGAGRGISSIALAREGWDVVALEPDPSPIVGAEAIRALAEETGFHVEVIQQLGDMLPFPGETFDLVYCRQVLHHMPDLPGFCREIGRVMKKDAVLIATREHVISRKEDLGEFLRRHPLHHLYGGENAHLLKEYAAAIRNAGILLTQVINPFQSDINLFPVTMSDMKIEISERTKWPWPHLIPDIVIKLLGSLIRTPGRVYTFVGRKL